jgi:PST family polysaccharide transporter
VTIAVALLFPSGRQSLGEALKLLPERLIKPTDRGSR